MKTKNFLQQFINHIKTMVYKYVGVQCRKTTVDGGVSCKKDNYSSCSLFNKKNISLKPKEENMVSILKVSESDVVKVRENRNNRTGKSSQPHRSFSVGKLSAKEINESWKKTTHKSNERNR